MHRLTLRTVLVAGFAIATILAASQAHAQVQVDIALRRKLYMVYEPIMCTVTLINNTGRPLTLEDTPRDKWFSFQVETTDGRSLPPLNPDYQNEPVELPAGDRLVRKINLTPLYPIGEFGTYRIRGSVFVAALGQYFSSPTLNVEITEGRKIWEQTVGVPEGAGEGRARTMTLLSHRLPSTSVLYLRVQDREAGIIFCTTQLGRYIFYGTPDVMFDAANHIHILQNTAPKAFLYSHFDVNGRVMAQKGYQGGDTRPYLARGVDGQVSVSGGTLVDLKTPAPEKSLPKLGDRPVALPTPAVKPPPEDKRPKSLLGD